MLVTITICCTIDVLNVFLLSNGHYPQTWIINWSNKPFSRINMKSIFSLPQCWDNGPWKEVFYISSLTKFSSRRSQNTNSKQVTSKSLPPTKLVLQALYTFTLLIKCIHLQNLIPVLRPTNNHRIKQVTADQQYQHIKQPTKITDVRAKVW